MGPGNGPPAEGRGKAAGGACEDRGPTSVGAGPGCA